MNPERHVDTPECAKRSMYIAVTNLNSADPTGLTLEVKQVKLNEHTRDPDGNGNDNAQVIANSAVALLLGVLLMFQ